MSTSHTWYRLCVDVDSVGNPVGSSTEVHHGERKVAIHVLTPPEPFDAAEEVFEHLLADLWSRYGRQLPLFDVPTTS